MKKAQQRLYILRQLRKFNLPQELLKQLYSAIIESVLCTSITVWFSSATKSDLRRQRRVVRTAERIIATDVCRRPRSDRLCTLASHGACTRMGNFCLGGMDSLLWPLRALQGGHYQDLRSFCFRPRGFAPSHNAS